MEQKAEQYNYDYSSLAEYINTVITTEKGVVVKQVEGAADDLMLRWFGCVGSEVSI